MTPRLSAPRCLLNHRIVAGGAGARLHETATTGKRAVGDRSSAGMTAKSGAGVISSASTHRNGAWHLPASRTVVVELQCRV